MQSILSEILFAGVRFGHSCVPFVRDTPAFELLLESPPLDPEAFGRAGAIAPAGHRTSSTWSLPHLPVCAASGWALFPRNKVRTTPS